MRIGLLVRPAARDALWRWREVAAAAALALLALALGASTFGVLRWVAVAAGLAGLLVAGAGARRLRFARAAGGGGAGVVELDERRLSYWGPFGGGAVDLGELRRLDLGVAGGSRTWLLTTGAGERLAVPVDAAGADALLDAFAALPGLSVDAVLAALDRPGIGPVTLWRAPPAPPRLH